ncbi:hypothetical protein LEP1GSC041_2530 [Leptospira noguchii str. 2006001870]|nr:hypothetical protein LEP1GSC041_2530 [Leptospira noguchii str. 2006001870]
MFLPWKKFLLFFKESIFKQNRFSNFKVFGKNFCPLFFSSIQILKKLKTFPTFQSFFKILVLVWIFRN